MHYLDNAATTRVADAVADTADAVLRAHYANPSSLYAPGAQSEFVGRAAGGDRVHGLRLRGQ